MISPTSNGPLQKILREDEFRLKSLQERAEYIRKAMAAFELYLGDDVKDMNPLEMFTALDTLERDISTMNRKVRSGLMLLCHLSGNATKDYVPTQTK